MMAWKIEVTQRNFVGRNSRFRWIMNLIILVGLRQCLKLLQSHDLIFVWGIGEALCDCVLVHSQPNNNKSSVT